LPSKTVPSSRARIAAFNSDCPPVFSGRGVSHIETWRAVPIQYGCVILLLTKAGAPVQHPGLK
jgi:hypothetical protein